MERVSQSSSAKTERKVIEKNRRNYMKSLYFNLNSLLPNQTSREALPLPDQIDEVINYIKNLEANLKKSEEKKKSLMGKKRLYTSSTERIMPNNLKTPRIEIHQMAHALHVALTCGLNDQFLFYQIIQILQEEGAEVLNASFSVVGDSILHSFHAQIGVSALDLGAAKLSDKLKNFVNGSTSDEELQQEFWDFDIYSQTDMGLLVLSNINESSHD